MHKFWSGITVSLALLASGPAEASAKDWSLVSDVGEGTLVAAALGVPAIQGDWKGDLQAAGSLVAAEATSVTLKELIHERRPDGSDTKSFPSGHTAVSFAAATTLEKRYGYKVGLPAFAVATLVAASRVAADKHYVHDVLAGAAIGAAAGWLITSKRSDRVQWIPWTEGHGGGVTLSARW